jgi:hypothetical protein
VQLETARSKTAGKKTVTKTVLRAYDPVAKRENWKVELPTSAYFTRLEGGYLIAHDKQGPLKLLDLETGSMRAFQDPISTTRVGKRKRPSAMTYALADRDNIYLVTSSRSNQRRQHAENLLSIPANGMITAFERNTGRKLWSQRVAEHNLVYQSLSQSPVLLFLTRINKKDGGIWYQTLKILMLDKQTGRKLAEKAVPSSSGLRMMTIDRAGRYLELRSYAERLRLRAIDRLAETPPVAAPKPPLTAAPATP